MFLEQRLSVIMDILNKNGSVSIRELVTTLNVSEATVRRDLDELERSNLLKRTHGGAISISSSIFERNYKEEEATNSKEKESIARVAAKLVNDGDTVLLDSGTTTEKISRALADKNIIIITNSTMIPSEAITFRATIYFIGGLLRPNLKAIVGSEAERFVRTLRPDKAFISANGVYENEASTPDLSEAGIKRAMLESAKKKYLAVDHSKFGKRFLSVFTTIDKFDGIITDDGLDRNTIKYYKSNWIPVYTEKTYGTDKRNGGVEMDINDIIQPNLIVMDLVSSEKEDVIKELISVLTKYEHVTDADAMFEAVMKRESEFSTGIDNGIAIPHAKSKYVEKPVIAFGRSKAGIKWSNDDGEDLIVNLIFLIAVPLESYNQHLRILAQISRKLTHKSVRDSLLKASTAQEVMDALK